MDSDYVEKFLFWCICLCAHYITSYSNSSSLHSFTILMPWQKFDECLVNSFDANVDSGPGADVG